MMVMSELPASEMLFTASSTMAMECVIRPMTALNPARNTLAMMPMMLVWTMILSRDCSRLFFSRRFCAILMDCFLLYMESLPGLFVIPRPRF